MIIEPLFDKNLILEKSNNISIKINKPTFKKIVLNKTEFHEGIGDNYYSIIKHDKKIKIFYRSLNIPNFYVPSENCIGLENTCYAESDDGLNFNKPILNNNSNILFTNGTSHNFCVTENNNELYGIGGTAFTSKDLLILKNINNEWSVINKITENDIFPNWKHPNHFDSHNIIFYDYNCNHYKIYLRDNKNDRRFIQYTTLSSDLLNFEKFKNITIDYEGEIYTSNFKPYPNSKYYIGFPTSHIQSNFHKKGLLCYSKDGFDWKILDFNICDDIDTPYMIQNGIIDINNNFYIYVRTNCYDIYNSNLACYSFELNRIQSIECKEYGFITFGFFEINSIDIYLNFKSNDDNGFIMIQMYDVDDNLINESENMSGNLFEKNIIWKHILDIKDTLNIKLKVYLKDSVLYSLGFKK